MSAAGPGATLLGAPGPGFWVRLESESPRSAPRMEAVKWPQAGCKGIMGELARPAARLMAIRLCGDRITDLLGEDIFTDLLQGRKAGLDTPASLSYDAGCTA